LETLRDRLVVELEDAEGRDVAPIARELRMVLNELDSLPATRKESPVDQLAARRSSRRKKAAGL
jgi:hypothetical protein